MGKDFKGAEITDSVRVGGVLNGRTITSMQAPYWLSEADFMRLKGGSPKTASIAGVIAAAISGYAISLAPKLTPYFSGLPVQVTFPETITVLIGWGVAGVFYVVGFALPNERSEVMKKISAHFAGSKPSLKILGDD